MLAERIDLHPFVADISRLNGWLDSAFVRSGVDDEVAASLKLCINEYVANLISYGFTLTVAPAISIEIEIEPEVARAVVSDNGAPFDIRSWPPTEIPRDLLSAKPGGFGIALIRERASDVDYARHGDRNVLKLVCRKHHP